MAGGQGRIEGKDDRRPLRAGSAGIPRIVGRTGETRPSQYHPEGHSDFPGCSACGGQFKQHRYALCDLSTYERRKYLSAEMERASKEKGGIHSVFVDGIADLCNDPNNSEEAFGLVEELVRLAVKYSCPIILVLHENPGGKSGGDYAKTRGHLGSQLERKAETNIRITIIDEISTVQLERCRNAGLPKHLSPRFRWSEIHGMHVSIPPDDGSEALAKKRNEDAEIVEAVFDGLQGSIKYAALGKRIESVLRCSSATANRRIEVWQEAGLIQKRAAGGYVKV